MYKLISYWTAPSPADVAEFEREYHDSHLPLAGAVPRLGSLVVTRTSDGEPSFYRVAELTWDSIEDFEVSTQSPEWQALIDDTVRMIGKYGVTTGNGMGEPREQQLG